MIGVVGRNLQITSMLIYIINFNDTPTEYTTIADNDAMYRKIQLQLLLRLLFVTHNFKCFPNLLPCCQLTLQMY